MVRYLFDSWRDETGSVLTTSTTLTYTVAGDKTFTAVYAVSPPTVRRIIYQSTPVAVSATVNGQPINPGEYVEVADGAQITLIAPGQIEV